MIIDINQKKISLGDKYQVFIDTEPTHRASSKIFRVFPEIDLFENMSNAASMVRTTTIFTGIMGANEVYEFC